MSTSGKIETLKQLQTVTWDGDLVSKHDRDELVKAGLVTRICGWNLLTIEGVRLCETLEIIKS